MEELGEYPHPRADHGVLVVDGVELHAPSVGVGDCLDAVAQVVDALEVRKRAVAGHKGLRVRIAVGPCEGVLHPLHASVEDDGIGVEVVDEERRDLMEGEQHVPVVEHAALLRQRAGEKYLRVAEAQREEQPAPHRAYRNAAILRVDGADVRVAHRVVELLDVRLDEDVGGRRGRRAEINLRPRQLDAYLRLHGDVLHEEVRQAARGNLVDGVHDDAVAVREFEMSVDPSRVLQMREVESAHAEHYLPARAVDVVAVYVDVAEIIVGAYRLELAVGAQQRRVVPHAYVAHGVLVRRELLRRHFALGREGYGLHVVEAEAAARVVEVVAEIGFLAFVLVRLDYVLLHNAGNDGARRPADDDERADDDGGELPHGLEEVDAEQHGRREHSEGENRERRQHDARVGVARAPDDARRREEQLVAVKPVARAPEGENQRAEQRQMQPRRGSRVWPPVLDGYDARHEVDGARADEREHQHALPPRLHKFDERQREDVEAYVDAEERVRFAEGHGVAEFQEFVPHTHRRQRVHDGDDESDDEDQLPHFTELRILCRAAEKRGAALPRDAPVDRVDRKARNERSGEKLPLRDDAPPEDRVVAVGLEPVEVRHKVRKPRQNHCEEDEETAEREPYLLHLRQPDVRRTALAVVPALAVVAAAVGPLAPPSVHHFPEKVVYVQKQHPSRKIFYYIFD